MVKALIELDDNTNRVLNIVKATYDLKDKGEAIAFVIAKYAETEGKPELTPEFHKKLRALK